MGLVLIKEGKCMKSLKKPKHKKVQLTIKKWDGSWGVEETLTNALYGGGDWTMFMAHNSTATEAQDFAWQCAKAHADQGKEVTVTIEARGDAT